MSNAHITPCRAIRCTTEGPIGWLRLDNPTRLNAISMLMFKELAEGIERLATDDAIRVIVLTGNGTKAFCAGGDISEFDELRTGAAMEEHYAAAARAAMARLRNAGKPTIAMISGYCLGGGMSIAASCDLRVAADDARLGIPAAKRGLSYDFHGIQQLVQLVGPSRARLILYTGRQFGGREAYAIGLVDEVVAPAELENHVRALATSIAANAPLSVKASRLIIDTTLRDPSERDLAACAAAEVACLDSADYAEATRAFMEKRPPVFTGR